MERLYKHTIVLITDKSVDDIARDLFVNAVKAVYYDTLI